MTISNVFPMNSSIYAIFFSVAFVFCSSFSILTCVKKNLAQLLTVCLILLATTTIYLAFKGRAALIGSLASIVYLLVLFNLIRNKLFIFISILGLVFSLFITFYFVKAGSSSGRLLIYKVVFTQLKAKDYINGLGVGKFKATYNKLQSAYFENNNKNNKEVLLAGNGYYLFNDWLQFCLEIGLIGLFIIAAFLFLFFKFFFWNPKNMPIAVAANASLICIGTTAFFSYPLQVAETLGLFIICFCIHLYYSWNFKEKYNKRNFKIYLRVVAISSLLLGLSYSFLLHWYNRKSQLAFELSRDGFNKEAEILFLNLENYPIADYNTHYNYAFLLYYKNELIKALEQIDKSLSLVYSQTSVKLKADILYELKRIEDAEFFYMTAVYITPGRMMPKLNLLHFYVKTGQKEKIQFWAKEIITMPVKIPSQKATDIQEQAKEILRQYPL